MKLQGFSLVRGTGLEPVTPCTSSGRVNKETTTFTTKLHRAVSELPHPFQRGMYANISPLS